MSYHEADQAACNEHPGPVALTIKPATKSLGDFSVRRVLPALKRRMVGPFVFFDHMGPAAFPPGRGIQVRPHPHIGIATITYLFEGQILHRDSLGFVQPIKSGAVNLMTAGRGIVHSERAGDDLDRPSNLHGIQSWIALPEAEQECEPSFIHYPAPSLPIVTLEGCVVRVIMGTAFGVTAPVQTYSSTLYLEVQMKQGAEIDLPTAPELAAYAVEGKVTAGDQDLPSGVMAVACPDRGLSLRANQPSRVMVIGGQSLGRRYIWWNFVSSSRERIEQAKSDWRNGRFNPVPGESEPIPLPE